MQSAFGAPAVVAQPDDLAPPVPTPVTRQFSFTNWTNTNPAKQQPGDQLDAEFDRSNAATNAVAERLAFVQRDDGQLTQLVALGELLVSKNLDSQAEWDEVLNA